VNSALLSLLTGLVSGTITAVVTYYATLYKARLELTIEYDKELRKNRMAAYKELWPLMKPLARYSVEQPITYEIVKDTSERMRDWYFDVGGIFLSRESRQPYFKMKESMQQIVDDSELQKDQQQALGERRLRLLTQQGTKLREALSNDVGSRRSPFI
jgi:hypothetical protein